MKYLIAGLILVTLSGCGWRNSSLVQSANQWAAKPPMVDTYEHEPLPPEEWEGGPLRRNNIQKILDTATAGDRFNTYIWPTNGGAAPIVVPNGAVSAVIVVPTGNNFYSR